MIAHIVTIILSVGCGLWFLVSLSVVFNLFTIPRIEKIRPPFPETWPKLAVIVPACNEGDSIEAAMRTRLKETYPNIQFVIVDDRSTDDTGAIADRVAADDPRFVVVHNDVLPEGWLGKVHALHRGVAITDSDWVLFTDADVHIEPGVLEKVIAWCEYRKLDQLTLLPRLEPGGFWLNALHAFFLRFATGLPAALYAVESPKTRMAAGAGAFNLFRRSALARTPGMECLRLEIVDDGGLAILIKAYGGKCSLINGSDGVHLRWYPSVCAMKRGFEKNGFAIANFSLPAMLVMCSLMVAFEWLPFVALLQMSHPGLQLLGGLAIMNAVVATGVSSYGGRSPVMPAIVYPVAATLMAYFLFRSGVLAVWRKGITWRGTFYPLKEFRGFGRVIIEGRKAVEK